MIDVPNGIKQAYDISTMQIDKIIVDNKEYRITNVEYYDDCYEEGNIFGTAIARCLDFEIENIVDLEAKEIEYFTGIKINGLVQWINLGKFIVQDVNPNDTANINKVTSMDYMLKTNIPYQTNLKYSDMSITLLQVIEEACDNTDLTLGNTDFANANFIVDSNQFEEETLIRQVIQAVAQVSGTVAKIKSDNKLYFINPNQSTSISKVFTLNSYKEAEIKRATHPINLVSLGMTDVEGENVVMRDEESIALDGENTLLINNNPFAYTQAKRGQLITALFNAVKGFKYKAYTFDCQCLPYLEAMDKIQFKDKADNAYDSYVFRFNYKSPNGLESTIEAPSIIKATVEYQNIPDALDIARRTEIIVNKQEQTITGIVSQQGKFDSNLTQIEQSVEEISQKVQSIADFTRVATNTSEIHLAESIEGQGYILEFQVKGSVPYLTPSSNLCPSSTLVPLGSYFTLILDKQSKTIMSDEAQIIKINLQEPLRKYLNIYDELNIINGKVIVTRRIGVSEDLSLYILETSIVEELGNIELKSFKDNTYIYLKEYEGIEYFCKYIIQNDYSDAFITKVEANSEINQSAEKVELNVNKKLEDYNTAIEGTIIELNSSIQQTAEEINLEVSKKVGNNEVISKINQSAEAVGIDANKIELSANDVLNLLAGNTINLTSKNIVISSDYLTIDKKGNFVFKVSGIKVFQVQNSDNSSKRVYITDQGVVIDHSSGIDRISMVVNSDGEGILHCSGNGETTVKASGITTPKLVQTSLEKYKKNIAKFDNALKIVKNSEVYKYNLKIEEDTNKKHIGFVIGKNYNTPDEVISKEKNGIDTYSMAGILWKAVQELEEKITTLENNKK